MGREATIAALEALLAKAQRGELSCVALRVFNADGTWDDLAIGGDDAEKAEVLDSMRKLQATDN